MKEKKSAEKKGQQEPGFLMIKTRNKWRKW